MKIGIVGDIHFCAYSSLVRQRGTKFSRRLENCIDSLNWAEKVFLDQSCDLEIFLGDLFDSSNLTSEEITATTDIQFNNIPKKFLVGNHEMGRNDLQISSAHLFLSQNKSIDIIATPCYEVLDNISLVYIPYLLEDTRKSLSEYIPKTDSVFKFVFSHNDIAGLTLGKFTSKDGFKLTEIREQCDRFFNGHLHNATRYDNLINVGNLTGQNFSEDAFTYPHQILILDIDNQSHYSITPFINPYAMNFYKLDSIDQLKQIKNNSVITVKCFEEEYSIWKDLLENESRVLTYRINILPHVKTDIELKDIRDVLTINYIEEFKKYVISQIGNTEWVISELQEICK